MVREKLEQRLEAQGVNPVNGLSDSLKILKEIIDDPVQDPDIKLKAIREYNNVLSKFLDKTLPTPKQVDLETGKSGEVTINYIDYRSKGVHDLLPEEVAKPAQVVAVEESDEN